VIRLPVMKRPAEPAAAPAALPAEKPSAATRWRVMVVDDNVDAATTLQLLVRTDGHDTLVVHDGIEALRLAQEFKPDIVLLDIGLPGIDGYEVARRLRDGDLARQMVLVAITGWNVPEGKWREAGFDYHLPKPVHHGAIRSLLESPRKERGRGHHLIH
jgi:CheY-like chemotaxis protein